MAYAEDENSVADPRLRAADEPCPDALGRHLPVFGQPKESRVDYKHLNQIMGFLRRAVINREPRPPGFEAELTEGGRVRLFSAHVSIEVRREAYELLITVDSPAGEKVIHANGDTYSQLFPFRPPLGEGALFSLHAGALAPD